MKKKRNKQREKQTNKQTKNKGRDRQTLQDKIKYQKEGKEREMEKEKVVGKALRPQK